MCWYQEDLERLENDIQGLKYNPKLVFYGSSTFTLWSELTSIFKEYSPLNLGFGGSTLAACTWYFDRIFKNIEDIDAILIYAGDNDLGDGRHPEEVLLFLENLLSKIRKKYGDIKCTVISIKPSINRIHLMESIHYTNNCIKRLMSKSDHCYYVDIYDALLDKKGNPDAIFFEEDGLHFNAKGYAVLLNALEKQPEIFPRKLLEKLL
ncbi:GDSL-type esterase/lipase family protein [Polaribacter sp. SA4-12]|uniref:GDSL-type esterase/lipase family protein n=1 Tax=Polaribacter sp. SA4-12 TaxID=1312072 RepID=UPI000B3D4405|nr:GDSL-type esterase/lipase family protein [Polaribacter sp. SA4-12]ARV13918.1 GDSL family lipase [Polaribacter sp. SA4-12]